MSSEHQGEMIVGICASHAACESTVHALHTGRFDLARVSVAARDSERAKRVTDLGADTSAARRNATPPFWAGLWRLLPQAAFLWVPGSGSLFVGGPLLAEIIASRDRRGLDRRFSAVGRGLHALGLSRDAVGRYERAIDSDKDLIIVQGSESEVDQARALLQSRDAVLVAVIPPGTRGCWLPHEDVASRDDALLDKTFDDKGHMVTGALTLHF